MQKFEIIPSKTYASEKNAERAVRKAIPNLDKLDLRWSILWNKKGRCFPVFFGTGAIQYGVHINFNVVAY